MTSTSIVPSGFFVLRTPLLPFDALLDWSGQLEAPGAISDPGRLNAALAADRAALRARLDSIVTRRDVREAIFVASPTLDESIELWRDEPESARGQRAECALIRYFARMAGRATPFGLFAGLSVGTLGGEARLSLGDCRYSRRRTRLDMGYLFALTTALARDPAVRRSLVYRPNAALYHAGGRIRHVEAPMDGAVRTHHLVAIETSEALEATLARARDGGASFECLASALVDGDVTRAEAEEYIDELVATQVLVSDLTVPVTGADPLDALIDTLQTCEVASSTTSLLIDTRTALASMDATGLGVSPECYRAAFQTLEALPATIEIAKLFQVDLLKSGEHTLSGAVVDTIVDGIGLLQRLARSDGDDPLSAFRGAFSERYGQQEVPLVDALDDEFGIGFGSAREPSPLVQGLEFASALPKELIAWGARETTLLRLLSDALTRERTEIVLEPRDLDALAASRAAPLPDAFSVMATIAAPDEASMQEGWFRILLQGIEGPSGASLLGRFCYADARLQEYVRAHLEAEERLDPDAVFAEIVHLPEGRLGNVLFRPLLRRYEIPYLGQSGAASTHQIPIADLMVSVAGNDVILQSRSLDRRIVPRLTTAHNYHRNTIDLYRFLCAIQSQHSVPLGWDWGPLVNAPFLPRVTTGRFVLARARWRLDKSELARLGECTGRVRYETVQSWRAERKIPRWIVLADRDNALPVDLDNVLSIDSFVDIVKSRDEAVLRELFPGPDDLCVRGPEGRFVHEVLIPFVRSARPDSISVESVASAGVGTGGAPCHERRADQVPRLQRTFAPGSEWLYVKVYSGTQIADEVLQKAIGPVVRHAARAGLIDCWFFIRYADPAPHLRVRMHGTPTALQLIWPQIELAIRPLLDDGRVWRVALDTYEREIERYGGLEGVTFAERLFHADSEAALDIIGLLEPGDAGLDERWRRALCGVDRLLDDLEIDPETRTSWLVDARAAFAKDLGCERDLKRQLGDKFRKERQRLNRHLETPVGSDDPLEPGIRILDRRSHQLRPVIAGLLECASDNRLSVALRPLAMSYVHMHVNRLLCSGRHREELVLYDFLARLYQSRSARTKKSIELAAV